MIQLAEPTAAQWTQAAARAPHLILLDHAHCEKKAASTAVGFLFRYPEQGEMAAAMSRLAREELLHFERVLGELKQRGEPFRRLSPSAYGGALHQAVRTWQPAKLVDELLIAGFIEARSCERFALLGEALAAVEPGLAELYRDLGPSEERHAELYLDLARAVAADVDVEARVAELAAVEVQALRVPCRALRLHAG